MKVRSINAILLVTSLAFGCGHGSSDADDLAGDALDGSTHTDGTTLTDADASTDGGSSMPGTFTVGGDTFSWLL